MLMLMAAIMMALVTLTACPVDDENEDDPDEIENGSNGGVAGKRLKSTVITEAGGETQTGNYTYNSDGTLKRIDWNSGAYDIYTSNPDGTYQKWENFNTHGDMVLVYSSYNENKKPLKAEGTIINSAGTFPITYDFSYQNGRLISHVQTMIDPNDPSFSIVITFEPKYDSNGRRTTTTETHNIMGKRQYTRAYNSDGTLQKVNADGYAGYPTTGFTQTFTWEDGKSTVNFEDHTCY